MKFNVTFRCRPVGALGIYSERVTVQVDVTDRASATQAAIPLVHAQHNVELMWGPDWCSVTQVDNDSSI